MKWKIINFIETTKHKTWVAWYLFVACITLLKRAVIHDLSKYSKFEAPYFEAALPKLRNLEYGSDEYKAAISSLGPALCHHYKENSHHPEYWNGNIDAMSPLDLVEMLCDWKAAGKRHKTGSMAQSLKVNRERFKAHYWFHDALERDAKEIGLLESASRST